MAFNFGKLWSFYGKACAAAGILKFLEPEKRTRLLTVYQKFCQFFFTLFVVSMIYTLATQYSNLVVIIIAGAGIVIYFAVGVGPILLVTNYNEFIGLIEWCRAIHDNEDYFHRKVRLVAKRCFSITGHRSMKILKIFTLVLVFDGFACTILFTVISNILPDGMLLEKYHPPFPFDLPFLNEATWKSFTINLVIQTVGIVNGVLLGNAVMSIYFVIFLHLLTYLDVILEVVNNFDYAMKWKYRKELIESEQFGEVLTEILEDLEPSPELNEFSVYTRIIVDMCSEFHK